MLTRLAFVIYWIGCALASLFVVLAIVLYFVAKSSAGTSALFGLAIASLTWLAGRAVLFIVAGAETP